MIRTRQPRRGAFDYLLDGINAPPPPPERGGPRVHIEIEIVERRAPPKPGYRFGTLTLWIIAIAALLAIL